MLPVRRLHLQRLLQGWLLVPVTLLRVLVLLLACNGAAQAQGVELAGLQVQKFEGALTIDFNARVNLPRAVEEAAQRGVPIYFVAQAQLLRSRWYWRDERVARVGRSWRLAYQPLTNSWRVGLGGLYQTVPTLAEALSLASRSTAWKLADLSQLDTADSGYYLQFSYRLDTTQLPGPMQFGLGGQGDWAVGVNTTLKVELGTP
jgi:Domain of unknown function (DUF4390)